MKKFRKLILAGTLVLVIGATTITAFAASEYNSPAEVIAGLTGQSADSVLSEKTESGETYGAIATEAGVLDEFKAQMLELKKAALAERVAEGRMTQARADEIIAAMEANQASCDGTGTDGSGLCKGSGFGGMNGKNRGNGRSGSGLGMGMCNGAGQAN